MAYSIIIGQAIIHNDDGDCYVIAESTGVSDSTNFWEKSNQLDIAYDSLHEFVDFTKSIDFFDKMIKRHVKCTFITPKDVEEINYLYNKFIQIYPTASLNGSTNIDNHLRRLSYFKFWIEWSLKNCDKPIFQVR